MKFGKTIESAEYIWHCQFYDIFQDFVGTPPRVHNTRETRCAGNPKGARYYQSMRFQTYSHSEFKFYYEIFYPARDPSLEEGKECARRTKRVPENIHDLLTPRAVAYWFMDDGSCKPIKYKNRTYINYTFSTQSFPLEDQKRLVQALQDNFSIAATIQKNHPYYRLYIRSKSTERFVELIRPYIHPCFSYKIR